jgi:hypothetical protein
VAVANYVKRNIVSQSYVDFYRADFTSELVEAIYEVQKPYSSRASEIFTFESDVLVSVEPGSVKSKARVVAQIAAIALAIEHYGGICDGIDTLYHQSRRFAKWANRTIIEQVEPRAHSPSRAEARAGLPGTLKRLRDEMKRLYDHVEPR